MSRWSEAMDARLAELYTQVPDMGCKGLCVDACGPIDMHPYERSRIRQAGVRIPSPAQALLQLAVEGDYTCPALVDGQCSVYDVRPLLCRLYGAVEDLRCEHGCQPSEGLLPGAEARRLVDLTRDPSLGEVRQ